MARRSTPPLVLLPMPKRSRYGRGVASLARAEWISVDPAAGANLVARVVDWADALADSLGSRPQVTRAASCAGKVMLRVTLNDASCPAQGYRLVIAGDSVELRAFDEAGAFYGLQTLAQIIRQRGATPPEISIIDYPDIANRAVQVDISRCKVPKMETIFALVEMLAHWKINQLQLYMEHAFAYSAHRRVWATASPFTHEEILRLDAYCRERCVQLVPQQNSWGHVRPWLRHEEYKHLAELPEGSGRRDHGFQFRVGRKTLEFLDGLYAELLPNFSSPLFNVGCDETNELGLGRSRKLVAKHGATRVYLDFLRQIHRLVTRHGRRMMFWADIIGRQPELIHKLPKDVIGLIWGYEAQYPFEEQAAPFAEAGVDFYVCPGTSSWRSIAGRTDNCLGNLRNAARAGVRLGADGYLITDWGDGGHMQYQPVSYPGCAAGAAYAWDLKSNRDLDLARALDLHCFHDDAGVLGRLILDLGRVQDRISKKAPHASILFPALMAREIDDDLVAGVKRRELSAVLRELDRLDDRLAGARGRAPDAATTRAELANTIALLRFATRRLQRALGVEVDESAMREEILLAAGRHEALWTARNRPGGMHVSAGRLRELAALY